MDAPTFAETLPDLYRDVLERVGALEAAGHRQAAGRIRTAATRAYSRSWNEACRRRLRVLAEQADRKLEGRERATERPLVIRRLHALLAGLPGLARALARGEWDRRWLDLGRRVV